MTDKFEKELEKFFDWAKNKKIIVQKNDTDEIIEWKKDMIKFEEPGRNKMETFLKGVMDEYKIYDENKNRMDDNKIIVVKYKLEKPKKKYNKKKVESEEEENIMEEKPIPIQVIEEPVKKQRQTRKKKEEQTIPNKEEIDNLVTKIENLTTDTNKSVETNVESANLNYKINLEDILCN